MSYSFTVRAATKAAAKSAVAAQLARISADQPVHAADADQAHAAACAFIDVLADDESRDIHVGMYGNVSSNAGGGIFGAGVNVSASLADRKD